MPVYNSKTGEHDYSDVKLANKITIDVEFIQDKQSRRDLLHTLINTIKQDGSFNQYIIQKILEGKNMPVYNPKTGEHDYVDVELVSKIIIDSEYIQDIEKNNKVKVMYSLNGQKEPSTGEDIIVLTAQSEEIQMIQRKTYQLEEFETILFNAINETSDQRIESVKEFKQDMINLIEAFVKFEASQKKYFAHVGTKYEKKEGLGLIRDLKANQVVGTFEHVDYKFDTKGDYINIYDIFLQGRSFSDLVEPDRFEFVFYNIEDGVSYSVIINQSEKAKLMESNNYIQLPARNIQFQPFEQTCEDYNMIVEANKKKLLMEGMDKNHPLYETTHEEFINSRLALLKTSQDRVRKEKLVNQFADIDLDL